MMQASLPMYDIPALAEATDAWWQGLAQHFRSAGMTAVPEQLTRNDNLMANWLAPSLLISQTCGYPLTHDLAGRVRIIASPRYHAPGCNGAWYASVLLVSDHSQAASLEEMAGKTAVINSLDSQSGCNILCYMASKISDSTAPLFDQVKISGGHVDSIRAVASGQADLAAVDAVTYALLTRHTPGKLTGTRILETSPHAPGLPYITRNSISRDDMERLRNGLATAAVDPELAWARRELLLDGFDVLPDNAYQCIVDMERQAKLGRPAWHAAATMGRHCLS